MNRYLAVAVFLTLALLSPQVALADGLPDMTIPSSVSIQTKGKEEIQNIDGPRDAGAKFVRAGFQWAGIETSKGVYDFSETDVWVQQFTDRGIRISGTLVFNNALYNDHGKRGIIDEENRQAFAAYCATVVARYQDYDIVWEIWNEPNLASFWQSTGSSHSQILADEYTELVKVVVPAMRAADPDCVIAVCSLSSVGKAATKWVDRCGQQGLFDLPVDAVSIHPYGFAWPELYIEKGASGNEGHGGIRRVLADYGVPDMPLINTEVGYSTTWLERYPAAEIDDAQGWMLARQHLVDQMTEVRISTWYEWRGSKWGMVEADWSPRPAYFACQTLADRLDGCDYIGRLPTASPLDYVLLFEDQSGVQSLAVWTVPDLSFAVRLPVPHAIDIPVDATGTLDVSDTFGNLSTVTVSGGQINVMLTGGPQYIRLDSVPVNTPARLKAIAASDTQIDLQWNDRSGDEEGFEIESSTDGVTFSPLATVSADATSYAATGLTGATEYTFRVRSTKSSGADTSSWSNEAVVSTKAAPGQVPDEPTSYVQDQVVVTGADSVDLFWLDHSLYEDGFRIYYKTGSASGSYTLLDEVGADVTTYSHSGLAKGIKHNYRIMAYNAAGESDRLQINKTIEDEAPSVPQALEAVAVSSNQIDLTWERSTDNERVIGYEIYRDGVYVDAVMASSQVPRFSDTGLDGSTTYSYAVLAYDLAENESAQSAAASATTIQPGVTGMASDDFDTGDWAGGSGWNSPWTIEGDLLELSAGGDGGSVFQVRMRKQAEITRSLTMGSAGGSLSFTWKAKSLEDNDAAIVSVFDGAWHDVFLVMDGQDDDTFHQESISLAAYGNITQIRVTMDSDGSGDTFNIDNVAIVPGAPTSNGAGEDDFETGDWTGGTGWSGDWATTGDFTEFLTPNDAYSGTTIVRLRKDSAINRILANSVTDGTLTFGWKAKSLEGDDIANVLVFDGTWHVVFSAADGDDDQIWRAANIDLSGFGAITEVQVQLDASGSGDSFFIDAIDIR
ncbi:MAG: fibronectin type III domain-containing protein [Verrucomicrobiota bacterium]